jgi:hypothetical protein
MTHDVLQSDIDLARKLSDARRPASEIITALTYRGIDSSRATRLLVDIQGGKTVQPDAPITINLAQKTSEGTITPRAEPNRQDAPAHSSAVRQRNQSRRRKTDAFPWFVVLALASAAVCVTGFVLVSRRSHTESSERIQSANKSVSDSNGNRISSDRLAAKEISLEIQQDGLRLCNHSVTPEDFLGAIFKILGAPSRTNQVEKLDHIIYAYDSYGLLVYSAKNSRNYSVVLDFEATDGAAGTKNPFVGTFKINNYLVRATTDAASLALIKELGFEPPRSASGIFRAQFGGLELVFGYFKSPERLSLAEIDFR